MWQSITLKAEFMKRKVSSRLRWPYILFLVSLYLFISIAVAPVFPQMFKVPDEHKQTAVLLVILSGTSMGLAIPSASTTAVLRGFQRFDLMNLLGIITQAITAVAIVIVLLLGRQRH
jgi:hypothetical protein